MQVKAHGAEVVKATLGIALSKCADALAVEMPESRIDVITDDLISMYRNDSLEDVILALKMGRRGQFGKVYGRLNLALITEWMKEVLDQKSQALEQEQNKFTSEFIEPLPFVDYDSYNERVRAEKKKKSKAIETAIIRQELRRYENNRSNTSQEPENDQGSTPQREAGATAGEGKPVSPGHHEPDTDLRGGDSTENRRSVKELDSTEKIVS